MSEESLGKTLLALWDEGRLQDQKDRKLEEVFRPQDYGVSDLQLRWEESPDYLTRTLLMVAQGPNGRMAKKVDFSIQFTMAEPEAFEYEVQRQVQIFLGEVGDNRMAQYRPSFGGGNAPRIEGPLARQALPLGANAQVMLTDLQVRYEARNAPVGTFGKSFSEYVSLGPAVYNFDLSFSINPMTEPDGPVSGITVQGIVEKMMEAVTAICRGEAVNLDAVVKAPEGMEILGAPPKVRRAFRKITAGKDGNGQEQETEED